MEKFDPCKINSCLELVKPVHILLGTNFVTVLLLQTLERNQSYSYEKSNVLIWHYTNALDVLIAIRSTLFIFYRSTHVTCNPLGDSVPRNSQYCAEAWINH